MTFKIRLKLKLWLKTTETFSFPDSKALKKLSLFYIEDLRGRNLIWEVQIG
jgi:hypothetical protein